jgi:hypothetical protein
MALKASRGLFRLWLVAAVLWIGAVCVVTWVAFPVDDWVFPSSDQRIKPATATPAPPPGFVLEAPAFDPSKPYQIVRTDERQKVLLLGTAAAFLPPAFLLALGSALVWVFKGFRS